MKWEIELYVCHDWQSFTKTAAEEQENRLLVCLVSMLHFGPRSKNGNYNPSDSSKASLRKRHLSRAGRGWDTDMDRMEPTERPETWPRSTRVQVSSVTNAQGCQPCGLVCNPGSLTIAGLKSSLCIGTHRARGTRMGRWRDLFTTLSISNLARSEFSLVKSKMTS